LQQCNAALVRLDNLSAKLALQIRQRKAPKRVLFVIEGGSWSREIPLQIRQRICENVQNPSAINTSKFVFWGVFL
jgi:hypothetical protein